MAPGDARWTRGLHGEKAGILRAVPCVCDEGAMMADVWERFFFFSRPEHSFFFFAPGGPAQKRREGALCCADGQAHLPRTRTPHSFACAAMPPWLGDAASLVSEEAVSLPD